MCQLVPRLRSALPPSPKYADRAGEKYAAAFSLVSRALPTLIEPGLCHGAALALEGEVAGGPAIVS